MVKEIIYKVFVIIFSRLITKYWQIWNVVYKIFAFLSLLLTLFSLFLFLVLWFTPFSLSFFLSLLISYFFFSFSFIHYFFSRYLFQFFSFIHYFFLFLSLITYFFLSLRQVLPVYLAWATCQSLIILICFPSYFKRCNIDNIYIVHQSLSLIIEICTSYWFRLAF